MKTSKFANLSAVETTLLDLLQTHGSITMPEAAHLTGISYQVIRNNMISLENRRMVQRNLNRPGKFVFTGFDPKTGASFTPAHSWGRKAVPFGLTPAAVTYFGGPLHGTTDRGPAVVKTAKPTTETHTVSVPSRKGPITINITLNIS